MAEARKKKTKDRHPFEERIIWLCIHTAVPFLKKAHGVVKTAKLTLPDGPCVVLYNHCTDLDVVWLQDAFERQMYCIASEHIVRTPLAGKLISFFFAPILLKKGTGGSSVVMEMHRHLKKGYHILMAPEGMRSGNGLTGEFVPATAAVLKKLKCNVVTVRFHGGYFTTPRWGKGIRKGRMTLEKVAEYTPSQIAELSVEAFHEKLTQDLYVDAYEDNRENPVAFRGKKLAEGLELQTGICPVCQKFNTIRTKKDTFACSCGMRGTIDAYGILKGEGLPFTTVTEWDRWCDAFIEEEAPKWIGSEAPILSNHDQVLKEILAGHKDHIADKGDLVLTAKSVRVGGTEIRLSDLSECTIFGYGKLLLFTTDRHYYEIDGEKYPGVIYHKIIQELKKQSVKATNQEVPE